MAGTIVEMPFISVNESGFKDAVFLVDTGSTDNNLFGYIYEQVKDLLKEDTEEEYTLIGIDGKTQKVIRVISNVPFYIYFVKRIYFCIN